MTPGLSPSSHVSLETWKRPERKDLPHRIVSHSAFNDLHVTTGGVRLNDEETGQMARSGIVLDSAHGRSAGENGAARQWFAENPAEC